MRPASAPAAPRRRFVRDERGQTFPFMVSLLLALFIVAAVVIDVGQAVNRRIFLQIAADAGAFTGASEMARGMNTIAQLNGIIQKAWGGMTVATTGFTLAWCPASDLGVTGYGVVQAATSTLIKLVNVGYGRRARSEAERVTKYNAMDLFPDEKLEMGETDLDNGLTSPRPAAWLVDLEEVPEGTWPEGPALSSAKTSANWLCTTIGEPQKRSATFSLWYQKRGRNPIAFVWVVKAPATRARVFDAFFGGQIIPKMTAAAVAKPVGGEIKTAREKYVAKLIPVRDLRGMVWDRLKRKFRRVLH